MTILFEEETEVSFDFDYEALAREVITAACDAENCPYEAEVNLTLTDNQGIHEMNREYRDMDRPTDVLSFPMLEYTTPGDFEFLRDEAEENFNPDTGEALLGDIIISVEKVKEQASEFGHSEIREYAFLITHSMLHLFGYDHMEADEASVMEEKQRILMEGLQILR